jgi:hypothetical protein
MIHVTWKNVPVRSISLIKNIALWTLSHKKNIDKTFNRHINKFGYLPFFHFRSPESDLRHSLVDNYTIAAYFRGAQNAICTNSLF